MASILNFQEGYSKFPKGISAESPSIVHHLYSPLLIETSLSMTSKRMITNYKCRVSKLWVLVQTFIISSGSRLMNYQSPYDLKPLPPNDEDFKANVRVVYNRPYIRFRQDTLRLPQDRYYDIPIYTAPPILNCVAKESKFCVVTEFPNSADLSKRMTSKYYDEYDANSL